MKQPINLKFWHIIGMWLLSVIIMVALACCLYVKFIKHKPVQKVYELNGYIPGTNQTWGMIR